MENEQDSSRPGSEETPPTSVKDPEPETQEEEEEQETASTAAAQEDDDPAESESPSSKRQSTTAAATIQPPQRQAPPPADEKPPAGIVYENTYKTKPAQKFSSLVVKRAVDELLAVKLKGVKYDGDTTPELTRVLADEILAVVKGKWGEALIRVGFEIERYKYVVDVTIGEYKGQGIRIASRCVWDTSTDSYSSSSFRNVCSVFCFTTRTKATLFAVAIVFGGYQE
jgi:hypothetical protein